MSADASTPMRAFTNVIFLLLFVPMQGGVMSSSAVRVKVNADPSIKHVTMSHAV
ncbi:hypothetical protein BD309DRAFT_1024686 [Dichomitus squalens]|nr:hypothetical protein BD309DRAFT_1024686 [Dichomitus squalens]